MTGLSGDVAFEEAAAGELSGPLRFTKNMATATATTTSAAKALRGLDKERLVGGSDRLAFPEELDFGSLERFMPLENSLDRSHFETNIVCVAWNSVGTRRAQLESAAPDKTDFEFMAPGIIANNFCHILWKEQIRQFDNV